MNCNISEHINKIINSDCLDILKKLPDKSIDLCVTDPPYGIGESMKKNESRGKLAAAKNYGYSRWDEKIPDKIIFDEIFRVSKNQVICGGNYFVEYLKNSPCWIVWDKINGGSDFADCELIYTSFSSAVRLIRYMWAGMLHGKSIEEGHIPQGDKKKKEIRIHPTQKPLALFEWIIYKYTEPGALILDPFSGSGTTAIACHNLKREFICIEKDKKYFELSNRRLQERQAQGDLF